MDMAYEGPFTVTYDGGTDMFTPYRISTASISFIGSNYMDDIFPSKATDTSVKLYNNDTNEVVWQGYIKANIYDCGYEKENEEITLEASDGLAALQYINYSDIDSTGGASSFETARIHTAYDIIKNMCKKVGINSIYVQACKKKSSGDYIYIDDLMISEKNFYSSDTDEPWKCSEVLSEISKYLGFTAIQIRDSLYLYDYAEFKASSTATFLKYTLATDTKVGTNINIYGSAELSEDYMENGGSISFFPVYNKATVKDSLYTIEDIFPNFLDADGEDVTYRLGDSSKVIMATRPTTPFKYTNKKREKKTESDDATFDFPIKLLDCKGWKSQYWSGNTSGGLDFKRLTQDMLKSESAVTRYIGGTIIEKAQIRASHKYYDVEGTPSFDRALFLRCDGRMVTDAEFGYDRWQSDEWINQVSGLCQYCISGDSLTDYITLFKSSGDYRLSCPVDSADTYMVMNVSAMWERYPQPYINSEWASEGLSYDYSAQYTYHYPPILNFILQCGNQYYNGQEWQTEQCGFRVPMEHSSEEKKKNNVTYSVNTGDDWNSEKKNYNNIIWLNWSTDKGYKISLKGLKDKTGKLTLSFLTPNSLVSFEGPNITPEELMAAYMSRYTINGAVWITNFSLTMAKDGSPAGETDVVYENVIDEENINELDEEEFRITTNAFGTKPSYSTALWSDGSYCDGWKQSGTGNEVMIAEQQWIAKAMAQYSIPTMSLELTLGDDILPIARITEGHTGKNYAATATEIDFATDAQSIKMVELH